MKKLIVKIGDKDYLGKDSFNGYTLTTDIEKACVFDKKSKIENIMKSSLPKHLRGRQYESCEIEVEDKKLNFCPVDFDETTEMIASLSEQFNALQGNIDIWNEQLSQVDKKRTDLEHYMEFNSFSACEGYYLAKAMQDCMRERRKIKNQLEFTQILKNSSYKQIAQGKTLSSIKNLENKSYTPRVLKDLFNKKDFSFS